MSDRLARLALSDEGFVFDPQTGDSFQASETGMLVLREMKQGKTDEEIGARMVELFDVSGEEAQRDCADFRSRLRHYDLL